MIDIFDGEPRIFLDENGTYLTWKGGQPIMDAGLENMALISILTEENWVGNILFTNPAHKIGSKVVSTSKKPITIDSIEELRKAVLTALDAPVFGSVFVTIQNPSGYRQNIRTIIEPPARERMELLLIKNGANWINQKIDPAHGRV